MNIQREASWNDHLEMPRGHRERRSQAICVGGLFSVAHTLRHTHPHTFMQTYVNTQIHAHMNTNIHICSHTNNNK